MSLIAIGTGLKIKGEVIFQYQFSFDYFFISYLSGTQPPEQSSMHCE